MSSGLACLILVASTAAAAPDGGIAPPASLTVRATPTTVKLGEPFEQEIVVTHEAVQRYEVVPPPELGDFELLGTRRDRVDGPVSSTTTFTLTLAAYDLGELKVPAVHLDVSDPAGSTTVEVPGASVTVASALPPDAGERGAELLDVKPPEELPVRSWRLLYLAAGLLAGGALIWALVRYLKRPRPAAPVLAPAVPLDRRTVELLDTLARDNLPGQGRFKEFYFRLSEITRGYLGERYGFEALECTTPELLEALRTRHTPGLPMDDVTAFATASDLYRYARVEPTADECKRHLELAYRLVHLTTAAMAAAAVAPSPRPGVPR